MDSKFDDLSDTDIDFLIDYTIFKNTKKVTVRGISVLKCKVANFKFFIFEVFLRVVNSLDILSGLPQ